MNGDDRLKTLARQEARDILSNSQTFFGLNDLEKQKMFKEVYQSSYNKLRGDADDGRAVAMARRRAPRGPQKAGDLIDDSRHENKRIEQAGELAGEFIQSVDFPGFVRDLLKGVFDANLEVTLKQMETYKDLLKAASASISKFVKDIDSTAAFGYLAENNSDDFSLDFDDDEDKTPVLKDKEGNVIAKGNEDIGDNQVKTKIMDAKMAMAKEHRALLREMILMGVTRLVVEKGTVKASVLFDMKASEKIKKQDKAGLRQSEAHSRSAGGGIFGLFKAGGTTTRQKSQISVSSVKSEANTDLAAKMAGSVEIIFKSDYFKLDNFATMYGPQDTATEAGTGQSVPGAKG